MQNKIFIIGDIHGCSHHLSRLLSLMQPDPSSDQIIFLGDLFDRGPDSWGVLQTVRSLADAFRDRFTLLRGNHEDYLLQPNLSSEDLQVWEYVGRSDTVRSFQKHGERMEDAAPWLMEHCVPYWKGSRLWCVHAGLMVEPPEINDQYTLFHDHGIVLRNHYRGPLTVTGHIALREPAWFAGDEKTVRILPEDTWLELPEHGIICIDTGCGKGGRLTGMVVEEDRYRLIGTDGTEAAST